MMLEQVDIHMQKPNLYAYLQPLPKLTQMNHTLKCTTGNYKIPRWYHRRCYDLEYTVILANIIPRTWSMKEIIYKLDLSFKKYAL